MPSFLTSVLLVVTAAVTSSGLYGQAVNRIAGDINPAEMVALPNHHPQWARQENSTGVLPAAIPLEQLTLILARSPQQEEALKIFMEEQQDRASPNYHHWLTPVEMGERFGLSEPDLTALSGWLRSQGLHVNWISPSRTFLRFGGAAGDVGQAFHTALRTYRTIDAQGKVVERMSVASDPMIPLALQPAIKAVHGLYTIEDHPFHSARTMRSDGPEITTTNGDHVIAPGDFATIYDANIDVYNANSIGIVGESRTDFADLNNFRTLTDVSFPNPSEIVPTAYGAIDPGPALTAPPAAGVSIENQLEATLDVTRAGSIAGGTPLLLVVATQASGGIEADAQYLVQTAPVPAQIMSISFGNCESSAGAAGVTFWDTLLQQAAAEGISVLVSSGDSGASGCDEAFAAPPAAPAGNSPNYICSSSYATCVGGTEFNEGVNPANYWSATNSQNLASALGYIPEGGWNEPLTSTNGPQVAASGGGVSSVIATPSWQTGTGVPAARTGRYTPDVAFSSSAHDGYFGCLAAGGGSCVSSTSGSFNFVVFAGTSAAAPSMAGITSLLVGSVGAGQGNLNPQLYQLAATTPAVFHDVTVVSSGVANCVVSTPSMCNNSTPGLTGQTSGQAGYLVTAGYDEVTGLGSLDVLKFLNNYPSLPTIKIAGNPPIGTFPSQLLGFPTVGGVGFVNGGSASLDPLSIAITGPNASDFVPVNNCQSALAPGASCSVQITFTPSAVGARTATLTVSSANASNSPVSVPLSGTGTATLYTPSVNVSPSPGSITPSQSVTVTIAVIQPPGVPATSTGPILPTGSVTLSSGGFSGTGNLLSGSNVVITIPGGALALGNDLLTATYTPDSASSAIYSTASGSYPILVANPAPPGFTIAADDVVIGAPGSAASSYILVQSAGGFTGNVTMSAAVTSSPTGAHDPPTFSYNNTNPLDVTPTNFKATLIVQTSKPASNVRPTSARLISWYSAGGTSLACLLFIGVGKQARRWRAMLGALLMLFFLSGAMMACGGSGGNNTGPTAPADPGTTVGTYVVTLTGTAGTTTAKCTLNVIVQ
jgi:subtilase family serine protease